MAYPTTPGSSLLRTVVLAGALVIVGCAPDPPQSRAASGKELLQKKDYKGAVVHFKSALQLDPESAEGRFLLGQALLEAGDPIGAVVELTRALKAKYPADKVMPVLARALLVNGEEKKLTDLYGETTLEDKTAMAALKSRVATAWLGQRNPAKADAAIAAALAAVPEYGPALTLTARRIGEQRRFAEALALVEKILAKDPALHEAWALKGDIILAAGKDAKGAEAAYRKALSIDPAHVPAHLSIIALLVGESDLPGASAQAEMLRVVLPKHPQMMYVDAHLAYANKNYTKARELTQSLMRLAPEDLGILQLAGIVEGQLGSLVLAETFLNKALGIDPGLPLVRRNLAHIYLKLGQPSRALAALKPLLDAESVTADTLAQAGDAYLRSGNPQAAEAAFKRALKLRPGDQRTATMQALLKFGRGDAATAFSELATLSASSSETYADQALMSAHLSRGDLEAALGAAQAIVKKSPGEPSAFEALGRVQLARKDFGGARAAFDQARQLSPSSFSATASLATIDLLEGKPDAARQRLEESIKADSANPYPRQALAELRLRSGAPAEEVAALLDKAIMAAPTHVELRLQRIDLSVQKRQYKQALAVAQDAASAMPNDSRILEALGRVQMESGNKEQAINTFRRLVSMDPKSVLPYSRLADVYMASGQPKDAIVILRKAMDVKPDFWPTQLALIQVLLKTNQSKEALGFALQLQQSQPGSDAGYVLEARTHMHTKSRDAALAALRRGSTRNPSSPGLGTDLYRLLLDMGRTGEADRFAEARLKTNPEDKRFAHQVSTVLVLRGELDKAEALVSRVLSMDANDPLALNNMAWILAERGKPGAVGYAQKAVAAMPNNAAFVDTLAMAQAAANQPGEALATQKRAVEMAPMNNTLRLNLAKIALQAGDRPLARTELDRLQALGARFEPQDQVAKLIKAL